MLGLYMAESVHFTSWSIFRQKPFPHLMRDGHRFAAENATKSGIARETVTGPALFAAFQVAAGVVKVAAGW
jgi:hypothetical protein